MPKYQKPLPIIDEDNAPYWHYCKIHELRMQKCEGCGHIRFPVSILCPKCHSMDAVWTKLSGKGKVFSYIVFRVPYLESYKDDIPYTVAIIQLEEGPRMESNLIVPDLEDIRIDMPVKIFFDDVTNEVSLPKFKPTA